MKTTLIGGGGEQLAAEALSRMGFAILDRNWKCKIAEIDIVARKDGVLYFIEVKYRQNDSQGDGFDYITASKLHHMQRAAQLWVMQNKWSGEFSLMAAAVNGNADNVEILEIMQI